MNTRNLILLLFVCVSGMNVMAQDTLNLLNGKKLVVKSIELSGNRISYRLLDKPDKIRHADPENVFSVSYRDGSERVVYRKDSLDPLEMSENDMRMFVYGEQDARKFYRNYEIHGFGFAAGVASGLFGFYGILGPPLFAAIFGPISPNVSKRMTFHVDGPAATTAGIEKQKYVNNVTGKTTAPVFAKQALKINCHKVVLNGPVDSAVAQVNGTFCSHRVRAVNKENALMLYRASDPARITNDAYVGGFEKRARDYKIRRSALSGLIGLVLSSITFTVLFKD
jgi:hypothetical protein